MAIDSAPFLDLFLRLRAAGMPLSPEQYDLLRQSLDQGIGLGGWDDLQRICRCLWLKQPPHSPEAKTFDRVFNEYRQQSLPTPSRRDEQPFVPPPPQPQPPPIPQPTPWPPPIPPRKKTPDSQAQPDPKAHEKAPVAVRAEAKPEAMSNLHPFRLEPRDLPVSLEQVQMSWRMLRRPVAEGPARELDLEATLRRIGSEGLFGDVVLRPVRRRRAELLLLVDEAGAMVPFRPALGPLRRAMQERRVSPGVEYRFTAYPEEYVYDPQNRGQALPLRQVVSRLHEKRTVVMIWSDGGAATRRYSEERVRQTIAFLGRLLPCVRQVIWLNPLPRERWAESSAAAIDQYLAATPTGQMIPFSEFK